MSDQPDQIEIKVTDVATEPKSANHDRIRYSYWIVTINTNKVYTGTEEDYPRMLSLLKGAIEALFEHVNIHHAIKFKPADIAAGAKFTAEYIKWMDMQYTTEIGGEQSRLHAHFTLKVGHFSHIALDTRGIAKFVSTYMGLPFVYVNFRRIPKVDEAVLENYLRKNPLK